MGMKPILFNQQMVKAILDGRKMVTRRAVKNYEHVLDSPYRKEHPEVDDVQVLNRLCKKPYEVGDIMWVRETWSEGYREGTYIYKADDKLAELPEFKESSKLIYHPSIHMPKKAARIFLKVVNVRAERLNEMTASEAVKEGIQLQKEYDTNERAYILAFADLWDSTLLNKQQEKELSWEVNPYVWVIGFEKCENPELEEK